MICYSILEISLLLENTFRGFVFVDTICRLSKKHVSVCALEKWKRPVPPSSYDSSDKHCLSVTKNEFGGIENAVAKASLLPDRKVSRYDMVLDQEVRFLVSFTTDHLNIC